MKRQRRQCTRTASARRKWRTSVAYPRAHSASNDVSYSRVLKELHTQRPCGCNEKRCKRCVVRWLRRKQNLRVVRAGAGVGAGAGAGEGPARARVRVYTRTRIVTVDGPPSGDEKQNARGTASARNGAAGTQRRCVARTASWSLLHAPLPPPAVAGVKIPTKLTRFRVHASDLCEYSSSAGSRGR